MRRVAPRCAAVAITEQAEPRVLGWHGQRPTPQEVTAFWRASEVADTGVQPVAYFAFFVGVLLAAGILLSGVVEFLAFRSILRQDPRN